MVATPVQCKQSYGTFLVVHSYPGTYLVTYSLMGVLTSTWQMTKLGGEKSSLFEVLNNKYPQQISNTLLFVDRLHEMSVVLYSGSQQGSSNDGRWSMITLIH